MKKEKKQEVAELTVRINSRVTPEQKQYIKDYAQKKKIKEGELHRMILASYMKSHKV